MERRVTALLLAAGSSRRMGTPKQLLPLGNKPVVRHCADALLAGGVRDIVAVVGPDWKEIAQALAGTSAKLVRNGLPESQMADSIRIGLREIDGRADILVSLADQPLVRPESIGAILRAHREAPDRIVIPAYRGKRGHPDLFPRTVIDDIFARSTLHDVIAAHKEKALQIDLDDEGIVLDLDTMDDYRALCAQYEVPDGKIAAKPAESQ